jgi:hypothetical protein
MNSKITINNFKINTLNKILVMLQTLATSVEDYLKRLKVSVRPTEEELNDLSSACSRLWELDLDRLVPNVDYGIDLQVIIVCVL